MSDNYNKSIIYALLAAAGIFISYKFLTKTTGNTPVIPVIPVINTGPVNYPPLVNTGPVNAPPITPTPPPTGVVAYFSRNLIINNIVGYLFTTVNAYPALAAQANFPSVSNINSQGYDTAQITVPASGAFAFGPWPNTGYYYMPKVNMSIMIGYPLMTTPASYPPLGSFINGVPYITPPDGAMVGLISPGVYGGQYYQPITIQGTVPMTGFSSTLGLWARFSVTAWNILPVNPITFPTAIPWTLNSDSGTQVVWAP